MTSTDARSLEERIAQLSVAPGAVACVWLGQAGYLFKSAGGTTVMVDPYFSDYAEHMWGVKRVLPAYIDPERFAPDLLLASHWHEDHLDMPTVRHYAASPNVVFGGPSSCVMRVRAWGWPPDRLVTLDRGETYQSGDVTITATFARHDVGGALAEDAVGFLLDLGGVRVWDVADTEYDSRLRSMRDQRIDVMFAPINGVGGNMSAHEAALLAWHVQPRIVSPMHYNMWAPEGFGPGATLDPSLLQETHGKLGGTAEVRILEPGKLVTLP